MEPIVINISNVGGAQDGRLLGESIARAIEAGRETGRVRERPPTRWQRIKAWLRRVLGR